MKEPVRGAKAKKRANRPVERKRTSKRNRIGIRTRKAGEKMRGTIPRRTR